MKQQLKLLPRLSLLEEDERTCKAVLESQQYQNAKWIFAFIPLDDEPAIHPVLYDALEHKNLALPITEDDGEMQFYPLRSLNDLRQGRYTIPEPPKTQAIDPDELTLILVPAVAYRADGVRLGRGKGYYDRYLSKTSGAYTLGVCRSYQLVEDLVPDRWDKSVDAVLCNGIYYY